MLLLTKSLESERDFRRQLESLGFEVFCSWDLINKIISNEVDTRFIDYFDYIIISETISNRELDLIVQQLNLTDIYIYRKTITKFVPEDQEILQDVGIKNLIPTNSSLEELRELLYRTNLDSMNKKKKQLKDNMKVKDMNLSSRGKKLFNYLIEIKEPVSRENLCKYLWGEKVTKSKLVMLSTVVNQIRKEMDRVGIDHIYLQTDWGTGYQIKEKIN
ncbi:winged helix-turn-helix domain-containing protein [Enterococcus gilvus]|uniref:winged helix-turn-helix domain-containing protein n=1 Tax=Enterococcus gilvus TaxID=160453 RepID=UPI003D6B2F55